MNDLEELHKRAVGLLSRREYCQQEMVRKLISKGADRVSAETVAERLSRSGWISDERFARELIRVRVGRGYGPVRIENELVQRGVDEHLASACLTECDIDWGEQIVRLVERKYRNVAAENYNAWAKRAAFLRTRGFTAEQIGESLGRYSNS